MDTENIVNDEITEVAVVEPIVVEPVITEPPVVVEPVVVEPVITEPPVVEPAVVEPVVVEPVVVAPEKTDKDKALENVEAAKRQADNTKTMITLAVEDLNKTKSDMERAENFLKFVTEQDRVLTKKYKMLQLFYESLV